MALPGFRGGHGEPLLLLHGLGMCWQVWEPVLPILTERFDVSAPDLPGFGTAAPLAAREPSTEALADAIERHLDDLGWEDAHVVGNSLGGHLALVLARRGRSRSVTAFSPGGMVQGWEQAWAKTMLVGQYRLSRLLRPLVDAACSTTVGRTLLFGQVVGRPWLLTREQATRMATVYADSPVVLATLEATDHFEAVDLAGVDVPVTVAWGARDVILLPRQGPRFRRAMPHSRLVKLAGMGHTPMTDDPATVADVIVATARADREQRGPGCGAPLPTVRQSTVTWNPVWVRSTR
jgi:pimeloyl-ACP methyl ester carboxylesterase